MRGYREDGTKLGFQEGNVMWKFRSPPSEEIRKILGQSWAKIKDKEARNKKLSLSKKGKKFSEEHKRNLKWSLARRLKFSSRQQGKNNPAWIDGRKKEHRRLRHSLEYRLWREAVFKRDDWTCVVCYRRGGIRLEADHIKSFSQYPDLRFVLENGRTLCISCHRNTENYGSKVFKV